MVHSNTSVFKFILSAAIICALAGCYAPSLLLLLVPVLLLMGLLAGLLWALTRKKGAIGEMMVSRRLRNGLPENDYIVLDDVYLPLSDGTTTQIDHIVISRYGIFAVETKTYTGWIFADARSPQWTQTVYRKKSCFQNPIRQNYRHVCAIADNLGIDKSYVQGLVVFTGDCEFKTPMPDGVVYSRSAASYIRSFTSRIIKDAQVPEIAAAIQEWQSTLSRQQVASHVKNLRTTHAAAPETASPVCPRCGAPMVLRTARATGDKFFGCSNYPKCRGIRKCV